MLNDLPLSPFLVRNPLYGYQKAKEHLVHSVYEEISMLTHFRSLLTLPDSKSTGPFNLQNSKTPKRQRTQTRPPVPRSTGATKTTTTVSHEAPDSECDDLLPHSASSVHLALARPSFGWRSPFSSSAPTSATTTDPAATPVSAASTALLNEGSTLIATG